jgi:hypothetical protein
MDLAESLRLWIVAGAYFFCSLLFASFTAICETLHSSIEHARLRDLTRSDGEEGRIEGACAAGILPGGGARELSIRQVASEYPVIQAQSWHGCIWSLAHVQ